MALNDAVPSSATDVFKRNADDTDRLLNATGNITTRTGKILPSWDEITQSHAAWNNRGAWTTATAYSVNDIWEDSGVWYVVLSAYTSGASAAADIAGPNVTVLNGNFGSAATKDAGTAPDQVPLNSDLGSSSKVDTGTDFDQVPINADIVYPVATVTDLRLLEPTVDEQQFSLLEYNAGTGLGGGTLYYDISDTTSADDGGIVFVTATGARIKRKLDAYVTPEMFGAVGDGLNDDTDALQKSLNSGSPVVSQLNYLASTIYPPDGCRWSGGGSISGPSLAIRRVISDGSKNPKDIKISELSFTSSSTSLDIIRMDADAQGYGDICIDSCVFDGGKTGIETKDLSDVLVKDCGFLDQQAQACDLRAEQTLGGFSSSNLRIVRCTSLRSAKAGGFEVPAFGISHFEAPTEDGGIVDCTVTDAGNLGILVGGINTTVKGCSINTTGVVNTSGARGIWVHDSVNTTVDDCKVAHSANAGIRIDKSVSSKVINNRVSNSYLSGIWLDIGTLGTPFNNETMDHLIRGNSISNSSQAGAGIYDGILVGNATDGAPAYTRVESNMCFDDQAMTTQRKAVTIVGDGSSVGIKVLANGGTGNVESNIAVSGCLDPAVLNNDNSFSDDLLLKNSGFSRGRVVLGSQYIWVDGAGSLRISNGSPASDTSGVVVGTQT